ncbi:MAG: efflux RND transporter periplasmic adaptor subunit [Zetaproteobacteria bacterium]|nr:efflux RND transporter periplasmic adaptor subunit [Zetaproteobacteria bacterium]
MNHKYLYSVVLSLYTWAIFCMNMPFSRAESIVETKIPVRVQLVKLGPYREYAEYLGVMEATAQATLISRGGGTVQSVKVGRGDKIKKGDRLCNVDGRQYDLELETASLNEKVASMEYNRVKAHNQQGNASQLQLNRAKVSLTSAQKNVYLARKRRDSAYCVSPIDGVVTELYVSLYDEVQPSAPLVSVADFTEISVKLGIPEADAPFYAKGGDIWISLPGNGMSKSIESPWLPGSFKGISQRIDIQDRNVKAKVIAKNLDHRFLNGQTVRVKALKHALEDVVVVPSKAVISRGKKQYVMVSENEVAKRYDVTLLTKNGTDSVIESGITEGMFVITEGHHQVSEADQLTLIP